MSTSPNSIAKGTVAVATEMALTKIKAQQQMIQKKRSKAASPPPDPSVEKSESYDESYNQEYMEMAPQSPPRPAPKKVDDMLDDINFESVSDDGGKRSTSSATTSKSCCASFFSDAVWPGMGLLGESYMLFSIGILKPIWEILYPDCFDTQQTCSDLLANSLSYSVIFGVIFGMISIGYASNYLGRRSGSIITASFMCFGSWSLTALSYVASLPDYSISTVFWCISASFFLFGIGVGGEYPLSASSASEKSMEELQKRIAKEEERQRKSSFQHRISKILRDDTLKTLSTVSTKALLANSDRENSDRTKDSSAVDVSSTHRGRRVQLVFSMQGMGIFLNSLLTSLLIYLVAKRDENNDYYPVALVFIWQTTYCIGSLILSFVLISRIVLLKESKVWENDKREQRIAEEQNRIFLQEQIIQNRQEAFRKGPGSPVSSPHSGNINQHDSVAVPAPHYSPPDPPGITKTSAGANDDESEERSVSPGKRRSKNPNQEAENEDDEYSFSDTVSSLSLPTLVQQDAPPTVKLSQLPDRVLVRSRSSHSRRQTASPTPSTALSSKASGRNRNHDAIFRGPDGIRDDGFQHRSPTSAHGIRGMPAIAQNNDLDNFYYDNMQRAPRLQRSGLCLILQHYGTRLFGVSLSWLLWDVAFYGNKLFQSAFLLALTGEGTTLLELSLAATINAAVALLGYFLAAFIIDSPFVGRKLLQQWGFVITATLFVTVGYFFDEFKSAVLVGLYLGTSFIGQLGPNATTFLIPVEVFPTEMRSYCHGIAAASGKVGALIAAIAFNFIRHDPDMFLMSGYASFAGCLVTLLFIPETNGLDLFEYDKKWRLVVAGRQNEYAGDADNPKYLSWYERHSYTLVRWLTCGCCCCCYQPTVRNDIRHRPAEVHDSYIL